MKPIRPARAVALVFYIRTFQHINGYSSAAVDIAHSYGVNDGTASMWLRQLERMQVIRRQSGIRKHIEVLV